MAIEYDIEELGLAAVPLGVEYCLAAIHDRPFDLDAAVAQLREVHETHRPHPLTQAIQEAARARRIPCRILDEASQLVQLGYGTAQRRLLAGQSDRSSAVGSAIGADRELTRMMLQAAGVPVPAGGVVNSAEAAWKEADYHGLPAMLRPRYTSAGDMIHGPLNSQDEVYNAYYAAEAEGFTPMVEAYHAGDTFRVLVLGAHVVAAVRLSDGGPIAVETLHADVTARIVDSVRVLHLESACVDLLTMNLERPLEAQNGVVLNVAAQPDYAPFLAHAEAMRSIGQALVATVAPEPNDCRIPIVSITGTNGKTTTTRLIAHLVRQQFDTVGMACTEGVYLNDRRIQSGDCSGPKSARLVLQHPTSQCAVLETARGGILREGLGFDRCDAAVVTNIGEGDHLGLNDIDTLEQLAEVKGTIVWTVKATGVAVLNAADPHVVSMAKHNPGTTTYFALAETEPVLTAHLSQGGTGVFIRNGSIIFHEGKQETILIELTRVPLTHGGKVDFQVENCLAAVGAARGVGLSFDAIRQGLASFDPFLSQVPGRFNLIDMKGATLVLDYGHNTSSLRCILQAMARFPHRHRTAVYSAAGDRRDCDILEQGALLGQYFDRVYIYEDAYIRGRQPGEITALFREGMTKGPRVRETYAVQGGNAAIEQALAASQPGDLLLLQPDVIDTAVELLRTLMAQGGREMTLDVALTVVEATPLKTEPRHDLLELREMHLGTGVYAARDLQPGEELFRGWGPTTYERSKY